MRRTRRSARWLCLAAMTGLALAGCSATWDLGPMDSGGTTAPSSVDFWLRGPSRNVTGVSLQFHIADTSPTSVITLCGAIGEDQGCAPGGTPAAVPISAIPASACGGYPPAFYREITCTVAFSPGAVQAGGANEWANLRLVFPGLELAWTKVTLSYLTADGQARTDVVARPGPVTAPAHR